MKKIIMGVLIFFAVVALGVTIFIATFNADRFRPQIVKSIEESLGQRAEIGHLSLQWRGGIALAAKNFKLYSASDSAEGNPAFQVETVGVVLRLLPLLKKEIQVASIVLDKPNVEIVREPDGTFTIAGMRKTPQNNAEESSGSAHSKNPELSIGLIQIQSGQINFKDRSKTPPFSLEVRDLDLKVKDFTPAKPFVFQGRAAAFSSEQNLELSGQILIPQENKAGFLKDFIFKSDLSRLDISEIENTFPNLKSIGVKGPLKGLVEARVNDLTLGAGGVAEGPETSFNLKEGRVVFRSLESPVENIDLEMVLQGDNAELKNLSADFAQGTVKLSGSLQGIRGPAQTRFHASIQGLSLNALTPAKAPGEPGLIGRVSVEFEGQAVGTQWPQISKTVSGQGRFSLRDGVITNFNVVREVFNRLSVLPGLVGRLEGRLPENYRATLSSDHTVLRPVEFTFAARDGVFFTDNLRVDSDHCILYGRGQVALDKTVMGDGLLQISPELSDAFMRSVNDLQHIMNARGQIEIPFRFGGILPQVKIEPDVKALTSKFVAGKTQGLVTELLQPKEGAASSSGSGGSTAQQLLGSLFQ